MSNRIHDIFPAKIEPWPDGVPNVRIRAVTYPEGLVVLWDPGGNRGVQRKDFPGDPEAYTVTRDAGCPSCGARRLRAERVVGVELSTEPAPDAERPEVAVSVPEPEPKPKRRTRKPKVEATEAAE